VPAIFLLLYYACGTFDLHSLLPILIFCGVCLCLYFLAGWVQTGCVTHTFHTIWTVAFYGVCTPAVLVCYSSVLPSAFSVCASYSAYMLICSPFCGHSPVAFPCTTYLPVTTPAMYPLLAWCHYTFLVSSILHALDACPDLGAVYIISLQILRSDSPTVRSDTRY
jgi:hypothetical protein